MSYLQETFTKGWRLKGKKTISILRYTIEDDTPYLGVEGTRTLVSGLSDLNAIVSGFHRREINREGSIIESTDKRFRFYLPLAKIPLVRTDRIQYDGDVYTIKDIYQADSTTGLCSVRGGRVDD